MNNNNNIDAWIAAREPDTRSDTERKKEIADIYFEAAEHNDHDTMNLMKLLIKAYV